MNSWVMRILSKVQQTFAFQLVFFIFIFTLLIFILMFAVNSYMTRRIMVQNAEQIARNLSWESINKIEGILSGIEDLTSSTALLIGSGVLTEGSQSSYINDLIKLKDEIVAVTVAFTPEYLAQNSSHRSYIYNLSQLEYAQTDVTLQAKAYPMEDWFLIPSAKKTDYWSEPWIDQNIGTFPITSYSVPIVKMNKVIGIVRADISLDVLQQIVSSVKLLKTGYAILITGNGTFVTHPADSLILNYSIFSYAKQIEEPVLQDIGRGMVRGKSSFVRLQKTKMFSQRWLYYASISLNKWSIGVIFPDNEIMADLRKVNLIFTAILGFGLIILLTLIYGRIRTIFRPLKTLVSAANKIGSGDFNVKVPETKLNNEVSMLSASFSKMQSELKSYMENLVKTTLEKDKISSEIRFAAQIQQRIIPSNKNLLTDVNEVSVFGILEAADEIGGDLYDAFMIDDKRLCFAIADVFGKGIVASMLMTMVQTLIRSQSKYSQTAVDIVREVNTYLCENNKQSNFITMIVGILDLKTGIVEFCNAGHTPIYIRKSDRRCVRYGDTHCTALGMFEDLKIESSTLQLDMQDFIILFTDGITEAMSDKEAFFGYQRLEELICSLQNPTPEGLVKTILNDVRSFTGQENQTDDLSILVIRFNHPKS